MRLLILAAALAFTASPALGQFRPELPQWAEQGNVSDQTRLGLNYDRYWDVSQDDAEGVRWKPILIGAGIGLGLVLALTSSIDPELECIVDDFETGECRPKGFWDKPTVGMITVSLVGAGVGAGVGAAVGWLIRRTGEVAPG